MPVPPDPEVPARHARRRFTTAYKLEILRKADACTRHGELGALLRKEGLYSSHVVTWRHQRERGLTPQKRGRKVVAVDPQLKRLKQENRRLTTRLQKAEALIDFQKKHVRALKTGQAVEVPQYDFTRHARLAETNTFQPRRALIVEGILVFTDAALRDLMDIKVFVDTDSDTRFIRRLRRDVAERGRTMESVIDQYQSTVKPMHLEFVEPSKRYADVIIPLGGHNTVAVDLLLTMLRSVAAR